MLIQDKQLLDRAIPNALDAGLRVVLAIYPYPPREIEAGLGSPATFGAYVSTVARAFPQVRQFVIGNEPNQPAFWRPQFSKAGANVSARRLRALPRRRLRRARRRSTRRSRWSGSGSRRVATTSRRRRATSRPRRSASCARSAPGTGSGGRTRPLMDSFSFHPYPEPRDRPARPRLRLAERRLREPRPREAGALGRVPRHRAADDAERARAPSRRGRLAGRHVAALRLPGRGERARDGRAHAGR